MIIGLVALTALENNKTILLWNRFYAISIGSEWIKTNTKSNSYLFCRSNSMARSCATTWTRRANKTEKPDKQIQFVPLSSYREALFHEFHNGLISLNDKCVTVLNIIRISSYSTCLRVVEGSNLSSPISITRNRRKMLQKKMEFVWSGRNSIIYCSRKLLLMESPPLALYIRTLYVVER